MALEQSLEQLAKEVIAGFAAAAQDYVNISGGWEVYRAPEYYCTVKVGEKLAGRPGTYVTLEQNIQQALDWSVRREGTEQAARLPEHGRFGIAVWGPGTEGIVGIIEIKEVEFPTYAKVKGDVERVCDALKRTENIRWGMSALHASIWDGDAKSGEPKSGADRLEERTENMVAGAKEHAKCLGLKCEWVAGCVREFKDEFQGGVGRADVVVFHR